MIKVFAIKKVAWDSDQNFRSNLAKPVNQSLPAEIRRTSRPNGADAGGGQHGNDRFRSIGHDANHPITGLKSFLTKPCRQGANLLIQFSIGQSLLSALFGMSD